MASKYTGASPAPNLYKTGLKFPAVRMGAYSVNMVIQASACCGKDTFNGTWDVNSALVLAGPEKDTATQKRLGLIGKDEDAGMGLHKRDFFSGVSAPLDNRPQIVGFVFKEGRMTMFRNGAKVGTFSAHGTALTSLGWINGWLDSGSAFPLDPGGARSTGQVAEVKLYSEAFSDTVMLRLQRLLECKWHIGAAQSDDWSTCEHAKGGTGGGGGSTDSPHTGYTIFTPQYDVWEGSIIPVGGFRSYRSYAQDDPLNPTFVRLSDYADPIIFLYVVDKDNVPLPLEEQPSWTGSGTVLGWDQLGPLIPILPPGSVVPGMSAFIPSAAGATAHAVDADYSFTYKARTVTISMHQEYSGVADIVDHIEEDFPIVPVGFPSIQFSISTEVTGNSNAAPVQSGPSWSGSFTAAKNNCTTGLPCSTLCAQAAHIGLSFNVKTTYASSDPVELKVFGSIDPPQPTPVEETFKVSGQFYQYRAADGGVCEESSDSEVSYHEFPVMIVDVSFPGGTSSVGVSYNGTMPAVTNPPASLV